MRFITSDGVTLVYSDHGSGQPIILLAGFGVPKEIWRVQVPVLVAAGYRVISLDSRGQGHSERTTKGQSLKRRATDVHELIQLLALKRPVLVGHSLGMGTCFAYLAKFGEQNIRAVVDVDQPPQALNSRQWHYGLKPLQWSVLPKYVQRPWGMARFKPVDHDTSALVTAIETECPFHQWQMAPSLFSHLTKNWRPTVAKLQCPLLLVAGGQSPLFKSAFAAATARLAANGQAVVIPAAGHLVMAEQSATFNRVLLAFLTELSVMD